MRRSGHNDSLTTHCSVYRARSGGPPSRRSPNGGLGGGACREDVGVVRTWVTLLVQDMGNTFGSGYGWRWFSFHVFQLDAGARPQIGYRLIFPFCFAQLFQCQAGPRLPNRTRSPEQCLDAFVRERRFNRGELVNTIQIDAQPQSTSRKGDSIPVENDGRQRDCRCRCESPRADRIG